MGRVAERMSEMISRVFIVNLSLQPEEVNCDSSELGASYIPLTTVTSVYFAFASMFYWEETPYFFFYYFLLKDIVSLILRSDK